MRGEARPENLGQGKLLHNKYSSTETRGDETRRGDRKQGLMTGEDDTQNVSLQPTSGRRSNRSLKKGLELDQLKLGGANLET